MTSASRTAIAFLGLSTFVAAAAPADGRPLQLRATGMDAGGAEMTVRMQLEGIDRSKFDVVSQRGSTVTLGYPKLRRGRRHCARLVYRLRVVPDGDPLEHVRALVPLANAEGVAAFTDPAAAAPSGSPSGWRWMSTIERNSFLRVEGAAARRLGGDRPFLRELTLRARMTRAALPCGGTNRFTVGPGVLTPLLAG